MHKVYSYFMCMYKIHQVPPRFYQPITLQSESRNTALLHAAAVFSVLRFACPGLLLRHMLIHMRNYYGLECI